MKRLLFYVVFLLLVWPSLAPAISKPLSQELVALKNHRGPYTFVVLGDNKNGYRIYKKLISLAMMRRPDFVVNTGDIIVHPGNREQWKRFWDISKKITVPYFLVVGNHDIDDKKSEAVWKDEVELPGNELYYSWTVGRSLFVVLNTCEVDNDKKITGAQLAWLKRTLNPRKYEHQFVFLHHPLYLKKGAYHYGKSLDKYPVLRNELQELLVKKKVDAVFAGHEHTFYRRKVDGVWHVITGGGGARLYGPGFCHFVLLKVNGPRIEVKVIDKNGVMRDEFVMR